ncbi:Uncharacterized protein dnm_018660 [Desulfonema magnum]|uniref:Uncharacterized protein n=1 Tax=Desulfonema magnum TaxID=45655 RepID=A0A975BI70_9BACT|nr:Uncharacterized protein dnm_018660 [Desulfonema magnum]
MQQRNPAFFQDEALSPAGKSRVSSPSRVCSVTARKLFDLLSLALRNGFFQDVKNAKI